MGFTNLHTQNEWFLGDMKHLPNILCTLVNKEDIMSSLPCLRRCHKWGTANFVIGMTTICYQHCCFNNESNNEFIGFPISLGTDNTISLSARQYVYMLLTQLLHSYWYKPLTLGTVTGLTCLTSLMPVSLTVCVSSNIGSVCPTKLTLSPY